MGKQARVTSCRAGDGIASSADIPACCSLLLVGGLSSGLAIVRICTFRQVLCHSGSGSVSPMRKRP